MAADAEEAVNHILHFQESWTIWGSNPVVQTWLRNSIAYYNHILEPYSFESALSFQGEQGELVKMIVPQARILIRELVTLVTKQKLSFRGIAKTGGSEVMSTIRLANNLSEQIVDEQDLDLKGSHLCELALVYGGAFTKATWRTDRGGVYSANPNKRSLQYKGDIEISVHDVWNVFYDYSIEFWDDQQWAAVRTIKNRWDLIAQFPKLEDEIRQLQTVRDWRGPYYTEFRSISEDDLVYVYECYHKPSPALPQGRMLFYSDEKTIYHDGPNIYGDIPIYEMKPSPVFGMGFGAPKYSELLPAQEMLDNSFSAIATNQSAFAVQSVTVPRGAGISVEEIGGMNFISFTPENTAGGGRPEPLQLTKSPPEVFNFIDLCKANMQEISSLSAAIRGSPPPGVTSGTAIATLTTNALEFISDTSKSYTKCMEKTMQGAITAYQKFSKIPRSISMEGRNNQVEEREFIGEDLSPIKKIAINVSNPLMQTVAGRSDLAEKLVTSGLVKNIQDYITVLEGGTLHSLYETEASENDLIESENERLMDGEDVITLATDDHPMHIRKHAALLNSTEIRNNAQTMEFILNHIMEHRSLAEQSDPLLQAMVRTGRMPEGGMAPPPEPGAPPAGDEGIMPLPSEDFTPGSMPGTPQPAEPTEDLLGRGQ